MWNHFVYGLADFFQWTFNLLKLLRNGFNYTYVIIGIIGIVVWMKVQKKYDDAADKNGTLH